MYNNYATLLNFDVEECDKVRVYTNTNDINNAIHSIMNYISFLFTVSSTTIQCDTSLEIRTLYTMNAFNEMYIHIMCVVCVLHTHIHVKSDE